MIVSVDGMDIFYKRDDGSGIPILILHGWGASSQVMNGLHNYFVKSGRTVISMDFPYFGQSSPPPISFTVFDYADVTEKFLRALRVERVSIVAHSFGGRIAVILAARKPVSISRLVLIDSAGCRPRRGIKYRFKVFKYKLKKRLGFKDMNAGSEDYRALPSAMKEVFVRVVNTHLEGLMKKVQAETLLIWGKDDKDTPLYMARRMNRLIKNSGLVILADAGHFSFGDRLFDVCLVCGEFFKGEG